METKLGKITKCEIGFGGYQDTTLGLSLTFSMGSCGVQAFYPIVGIEPRIRGMLEESKRMSLSEMVDVPVEVTLENDMYRDFRVLTEVL